MITKAPTEQLEALIARDEPLLAYFSGQRCTVCHALLQKVEDLLRSDFPGLKAIEIDAELRPAVAGQHLVFTVPTIILFSGGKEICRFGRNLAMQQLRHQLELMVSSSPGESDQPKD